MFTPFSSDQWHAVQQQLQLDRFALPWTRLNQAWLLNSPFDDATHHILKLESDAGTFYLKWLRQDSVPQPFWQQVKHWTGHELTASYAVQPDWVKLVQPHIGLRLADIVCAHSPTATLSHGFVLSRQMAGESRPEFLSNAALEILVHFFSDLHRITSVRWGSPFLVSHSAKSWSLQSVQFVGDLGLPAELVEPAIKQACLCEVHRFVPVMLDFRWDQLQWNEGHPDGIVDMDGWIMAAPSLNLAMLEYLLDQKQARKFKQGYIEKLVEQTQDPDLVFEQLNAWRSLYRLILFKLNWLGADNLQAWLSAPSYFDAD